MKDYDGPNWPCVAMFAVFVLGLIGMLWVASL
jgi:hypothetical protein